MSTNQDEAFLTNQNETLPTNQDETLPSLAHWTRAGTCVGTLWKPVQLLTVPALASVQVVPVPLAFGFFPIPFLVESRNWSPVTEVVYFSLLI